MTQSTDTAADLRTRSAQEVVEDHIRLRAEGRLEDDIARNYDPGVVLLTRSEVQRGHDGVRRFASILDRDVPRLKFQVAAVQVDGQVALLEWTGDGAGRRVRDGSDSFLIRDGRIVAQTIHYTPDECPESDWPQQTA